MISGVTVTLMSKTQTGTDDFNRPEYVWTSEDVENVLVGQPGPQEIIETLNLTGRKVTYVLGIPKGDAHTWESARVILPSPFAGTYEVIGIPVAGIEDNIPLSWNTKVQVERIG